MMKKVLTALICLVLLAAAVVPASAQTRYRHRHARYYRTGRTYYTYSAPHRTFWQKHRDKLTLAGGTLGGAMIGGIAGGHKGAAVGALAGAGGSALYTYKLRKRHRRY